MGLRGYTFCFVYVMPFVSGCQKGWRCVALILIWLFARCSLAGLKTNQIGINRFPKRCCRFCRGGKTKVGSDVGSHRPGIFGARSPLSLGSVIENHQSKVSRLNAPETVELVGWRQNRIGGLGRMDRFSRYLGMMLLGRKV